MKITVLVHYYYLLTNIQIHKVKVRRSPIVRMNDMPS